MIDSIHADRPHRASGEFAFHVLDVLLSIETAVESGGTEPVRSTTERPAASV